MNKLDKIKKEIHCYLIKNDWNGTYEDLFIVNSVIDTRCIYFYDGINKNKSHYQEIYDNWLNEGEYYDKYLLEFIGHILRKYKIKEVWCDGIKYRYKSSTWKYKTIERIK